LARIHENMRRGPRGAIVSVYHFKILGFAD